MGKVGLTKIAIGAVLLDACGRLLAGGMGSRLGDRRPVRFGRDERGYKHRLFRSGWSRSHPDAGWTHGPRLLDRSERPAVPDGAAQECWPYAQPFQAGQQLTLTSSCNAASRWTALGTNQAAPMQSREGERG